MIVLGIETSCDETSACLLQGREILSLKTHSQILLHKKYGGVVPEIASRSHMEVISETVASAFCEAGITPKEIDVIAVTETPGLIGGLLVGINFAKGLSIGINKPIIFVNHLEGHIFTCGLTEGLEEDFYCLLISGGHTQTLEVSSLWNYRVFGKSIDDSVGESFDKLSKSLGFGYPGGPLIEKLAQLGDENRFKLGVPLKGKHKFDFSFSGLKTHFLNLVSKYKSPQDINDICASFQKTICNTLIDRVENMINAGPSANSSANIRSSSANFENIVICGGVSANLYIRMRFESHFKGYKISYAPISLCTDNAAMIANIGRMKAKKQEFSSF